MRFSLRRMLISVAIIAAPLGIWVHRANEQSRAVAEIRRLGGDVEYATFSVPFIQSVAGIDFVANVEIVRLIRHGPEDLQIRTVTDFDSLVVCIRRFPQVKKVVLLANHREWEGNLQELFPNIKVVVGHGGII